MQKKLIKPFIVLFAIISTQLLNAQSNTLYYMDMVHQNNYLNPAYQNSCNGFLGLPGFSGLSAEGMSSAFTYNGFIRRGEGQYFDSLILDFRNIKAQLQTSNYLMAGAQIPILGIGFWVKNAYFTFDISNKTRARLSYPAGIADLLDGNGNNIGEDNPIELNGIGPNAFNYNEVAFGLSKQITHRLVIGGKLKILSGNLSVSSTGSNIKLFTAEDTYAIRLESDLKLKLAGPVIYDYDSIGNISNIKYDNNFKVSQIISGQNLGMAIDFGATYQFNDHFKFYGSVTDLGFISWHGNAKSLTQKGTFEFSGLSLDSVFSNSDYDELQPIIDSLKDDFMNFSEEDSKYTTSLNTNIFLGTTYDIGNFMNFGFLSKTYFFDNKIHEAVTLSANFKPTKWFGASLSYSYMNNEYRNLGLGIAVRPGPFQFYVVTDNLNVAFQPKDSKVFRVQLGFNFYFGCGKRDNFSMLNNKKPKKDADFM
jgi:hypothetical protein